MNPEAEKILKTILAKDPSGLTVHDVAFLKARWSYVGRGSRAKFAEAIKNIENQANQSQQGKPEDDGEDEE